MIEAREERGLRLRRLAQRIRVPAGFTLVPLLLIVARPTFASLATGCVVALSGLAIRAWASGCLRKNEKLTTHGPYAFTRNPLYLGTFIMGTGIAISSGVAWFVLLFMGLYLLIYVPVMFAEAETMSDFFPEEYREYGREVPLFLPRLTPYPGRSGRRAEAAAGPRGASNASRFDPTLYLRHREYRAALGVLAVLVILTAKLCWSLWT
ncbi:MAG TPA: isoprenylcysteine carboxylmethyltransferase family protein [Blastocatellia bacterium]|nr:isoprenylcysteine carboxylmethyltransferase family protein [Blastocatellia bacterium]